MIATNIAGSFDSGFGRDLNGKVQFERPAGLTRLLKDQTFVTVGARPDGDRGYLIEGVKHDSHGVAYQTQNPSNLNSMPIFAALAVQPDNKYLMLWARPELVSDATITRFDVNGDVDRSFGQQAEGSVSLIENIAQTNAGKQGLKVREHDGAIFAAFLTSSIPTQSVIFKVTKQGVLDRTFAAQGRLVVFHTTLHDLAFQGNDFLLVAGHNQNHAIISRYTNTGELDPAFGQDGTVELALDNSNDTPSVFGITVDDAGAITVVGSDSRVRQTRNFVARFTAQGQPDLSFHNGTPLETDIADGSYRSVVVQRDRKTLVLAREQARGTSTHVIRYTQDGSKDPGFGNDGVAPAYHRESGIGSAHVDTLELQTDGKIVVSGPFASHYSYIARLLNDT